jgi:hypothetical protein
MIAQINPDRGSKKGKTRKKHPSKINQKTLSLINELKAFENPCTVDGEVLVHPLLYHVQGV